MTERKVTAIIGAGASGLATARALRKLGHHDVVLLEAASSVGGKCSTMSHGGRTYELGAALVTPAYSRVLQIMREHEVPWRVRASASYLDPYGSGISSRVLVPPHVKWRDILRVPASAMRIYSSELRSQLSRFPRLDAVPSSWYQSFEHWARQNDATPLLEVLRPWITSFGYGFLDAVPAAYILNYMCVMGVPLELQETGYGGLWQRVAEGYDVRLDTRVSKVTRSADHVLIDTNRGQFHVDQLILSCALEDAAKFLDLSDDERSLFSKVKYMDYQVVAVNTRDMPTAAYVFNSENATRQRAGKPVLYCRRYSDAGVLTFHSYRGPNGLDGAEREAVAMVEGLGGRVTEILARKEYRHFPHVSSEAMAGGFYTRMEAMQGVQRTYYAGEVMSFACVESVVAYADQLAERMVGAQLIRPEDLPWPAVANDVLRRLTRLSA